MVEKMTVLQLVLIITAILYIFFIVPNQAEVKEISMHLTVGDYVGFNVDTDALWFGTVLPGGQSARYVTVSNSDTRDKKVSFSANGNISGWVSVPVETIVEANTSKNFTIRANVPADAAYGNYTGKLLITFKK